MVEGLDSGQRFTVDGEEVRIGRRGPSDLRPRGVTLQDSTVSSNQAVLRRVDGRLVLEHESSATNPTLVNGAEISRHALETGDRVQMGHVVIEVRSRAGVSLAGLTEMLADGDAGATGAPSELPDPPTTALGTADSTEADTQIRPHFSQIGELEVEQGRNLLGDARYTLWSSGTSIGRGVDCDVRVHDLGVSRRHCELVLEDGRLMLLHHSRVNATLHNGQAVEGSVVVADGDTIQLADRVVLKVSLRAVGAKGDAESTTESRDASLRREMEAKIEHDRSIEDRYGVEGSFLDVDVVNSYGMKKEMTRPEHIIVSFERFRAFVERVVREHGGLVLNSNGDELMCFFESTDQAVRAGWSVLERLPVFNAEENLLEQPFQFRVGVHTGRSLVDFDHGVAYSAILDLAGHLQKQAEVNGLVISEETLRCLPETHMFEEAGTLERESVAYYRMTGPLSEPLGDDD